MTDTTDLEQPEDDGPRTIDCRYCGPVTVTDPEEHLASDDHRLRQAQALSPLTADPTSLGSES